MVQLKYIEWKKLSGGKVEGFFIKTPKGYLRVSINNEQFYEIGEEAKIYNVKATPLGKVVKDEE